MIQINKIIRNFSIISLIIRYGNILQGDEKKLPRYVRSSLFEAIIA
ncbi:hypothetical protein NIASO_10665 [Niabella soli DSM 19437]|uniref:Uncharacterized protein n=1 Tax=Niabella soli DSM 19437 TaxID=929713 RepID=W0F3I3_9BACT|nr:hypothetical protein NIASO_10665 [Niabella soli DSM 19437]